MRAERALKAEIRKRRKIEERLTEHETRLRAIVESVPECIKLHDANGLILQMNPAGLAILEAHAPEEVIGTSVYRYIAPECHEAYRALSEQVLQGVPGSMEFRLISFQGVTHILETHMVPLRDWRGEVTVLLGLTRDITERKRAEERARRHLAELAHVARLSTMGEMATGIAHELNQPLTAIVNYASAGIRHINSGADVRTKVLANLERIAEQGKRAGQVIQQIREFVAKGEHRVAAVDINEIANTICGFVEQDARQRDVTLYLELADTLPPVRVEKIEIEQVLLNLARNGIEAIDAAEASLRELTIATRQVGPDYVEVTVRDTGPGIPASVGDHVFDPFFTTKSHGMGLGLSISRSIVETHGGRFWLDREAVRGATFRFTLPVFWEV